MIRTPLCELLGIEYPIALGGMPTIFNAPELAAAVSSAGGLGILGITHLNREQVHACAAAVRALTERPFGLNALMFFADEAGFSAALEAKPAVMSLSWPRKDQDVKPWVSRAHAAGCTVTFMAAEVSEALRGAEAGADVIVAQGTEGGGHVGWMTMAVLVPMVVDAVAPVPVMAAGGIADGRGLAAALAYGAQGVLLGTRFLASEESGLHPHHKRVIVDSDGHDTILTEIPDIAAGHVWPGAMSRVQRNRFIERWTGREWALRQALSDVAEAVSAARHTGDPDEAPLFFGQDAGLIKDVPPAADIVSRIASDAEDIIRRKLFEIIRDEDGSLAPK